MPKSPRIITLLTDFGQRDHFVAVMKGTVLTINPDVSFVDITHEIAPQDVAGGAFTLGQAYSSFPPGTIHVAVVDPGVGTARRALVASARAQFFVVPDNGLLTYVLNSEEAIAVHEITSDHYLRKPVSTTFHGRDVFAPVAAWISRDIPLQQFGPPLHEPVRLKVPQLTRVRDSLIQAAVLATDRFGNLITNLKPEDLPAYGTTGRKWKILAGKREITTFRRTFGEVGEGDAGEVFVVPGSTGYLEIAVRNGSAAAELGLKPGAPIGVVLG
jgi:S-adenosyl-L-methionine hydrolase (adenosine-forming)